MVSRMDGPIRLGAYGSYISDMYTPNADIDLCIEGAIVLQCASFHSPGHHNHSPAPCCYTHTTAGFMLHCLMSALVLIVVLWCQGLCRASQCAPPHFGRSRNTIAGERFIAIVTAIASAHLAKSLHVYGS
jgi:hypothetical protein